MWRAPSCNRSRGRGAVNNLVQTVTAWRGLLASRRLLAACWSIPVPKAGSRVWLGTRLCLLTTSEGG
eukprot:7643430-Alexandrium_andersonii.AAC.1